METSIHNEYNLYEYIVGCNVLLTYSRKLQSKNLYPTKKSTSLLNVTAILIVLLSASWHLMQYILLCKSVTIIVVHYMKVVGRSDRDYIPQKETSQIHIKLGHLFKLSELWLEKQKHLKIHYKNFIAKTINTRFTTLFFL